MMKLLITAIVTAAASTSLYHFLFRRKEPQLRLVAPVPRSYPKNWEILVSEDSHAFKQPIPAQVYAAGQIRGYQTLPVKFRLEERKTHRSYGGQMLFIPQADTFVNSCLHCIGVTWEKDTFTVFFDNHGDVDQISGGHMVFYYPNAVITEIVYERE